MAEPDFPRIEAAVREILAAIGEDPDRDGLLDTPKRVAKAYGEILGAHIIGNEATELIAELGLAINSELTAEDIENTIHAHPTLSESIHEAAGQAFGHAIHIV